jgi:polo-like kinase 1
MNELLKRRKRLTEPESAFFMSQLIESVEYMHDQCVIHRDLKLGNLFLDKNLNVKVGDLGLATRLATAEEKRKTICGTPNYIAPEVIQGTKETRGHSFEVDIWSMGVILFTVLVGKPPYEAKDVKATYQRIIANEYAFPLTASLSDAAKELIISMLQSNPQDRYAMGLLIIIVVDYYCDDETAWCSHNLRPFLQSNVESNEVTPVLSNANPCFVAK